MADEIPRSIIRRFAREQRAQRVQAETFIWRAVRNRRCDGAKFQRQVPLRTYIVDFICFERRLVVEVDGPSHEDADQIAADRARDAWLQEQGFRVLRLPNELVIGSTELAVVRIRNALTA
jgi:very-short-patch-repair endonuclease